MGIVEDVAVNVMDVFSLVQAPSDFRLGCSTVIGPGTGGSFVGRPAALPSPKKNRGATDADSTANIANLLCLRSFSLLRRKKFVCMTQSASFACATARREAHHHRVLTSTADHEGAQSLRCCVRESCCCSQSTASASALQALLLRGRLGPPLLFRLGGAPSPPEFRACNGLLALRALDEIARDRCSHNGRRGCSRRS